MAFWNQKNLPAPPTNTYISRTKDLDLTKLRSVLQDGIKHFKNEGFLIKETALLARILYRSKMKFRSAKEFKTLEKIKHALVIYFNTNMARDLNNILSLIPSQYRTDTYLPTKNMLSYILVRLQGFVKLMERVYDTCQKAAIEIQSRICIGHFWKIFLILMALVSRIYILVKFNTKLLCELYGRLLPHSKKLENPGRNWLPEEYDLPTDLREWLGVNWVYEEEFIDLTFEPSQKILDFFDLVNDDDDEVQFCDEYVLIDEEDISIENDFHKLKPIQETFTRNRMRGFSINEDDIGEDIADIIKINDTDIAEHDRGREFHLNKSLDIEDVGEEISDTEADRNDGSKFVNLDETAHLNVSAGGRESDCSKTAHNMPNKIRESITVDKKHALKSPRKKSMKIPKHINKNNTNSESTDNVILVEDNDVTIIPETPTTTHSTLEDTNTDVFLDILNSTKIRNKKKYKKAKRLMQNLLDINNKLKNTDSQNNKNMTQMPESPLKQKGIVKRNQTEILEGLNKKAKLTDNSELMEDSSVIAILETPLKKTDDPLGEALTIDSAVTNISVISKKNDSILDSSKNIKKNNKKSKSKKNKDIMQDFHLINGSSVTDSNHNYKKISLGNEKTYPSPHNRAKDNTLGGFNRQMTQKDIVEATQKDVLKGPDKKNNLTDTSTFKEASSVIVIPDTPLKRTDDACIIDLDSMLTNTSIISKKNDSILGSSKNIKKKNKKNKSKKMNAMFQDSHLINSNSVTDSNQNNKKISVGNEKTYPSPHNKAKDHTLGGFDRQMTQKKTVETTQKDVLKSVDKKHISTDTTTFKEASSVIVIPDTPLKRPNDSSIIVLDSTLTHTSIISKKNDSILNNFKKKNKKNRSKKIKGMLHNNKNVSLDTQNASLSLNNEADFFEEQITQTPLKQKQIVERTQSVGAIPKTPLLDTNVIVLDDTSVLLKKNATPTKKTNNALEGTSVSVLDNTLAFSKMNNSILSSSKSVKKKKKIILKRTQKHAKKHKFNPR